MQKMTISRLVAKYAATHIAVINPILSGMGTCGSALVSEYKLDEEDDDILLYVTIKDLKEQSEDFFFDEVHMLIYKYKRNMISAQELRDNVKALDRYSQVSEDDWADVECNIEGKEGGRR